MSRFDSFVVRYARAVIRHRWLVLLGTLLLAGVAASGGRLITFSQDYRVFFGKTNPQLEAFEALQDVYTKNDNIMFVVAPSDGEVFTPKTLAAVEAITAEAWKIPFAIRVDAVTNFQHTRADGDDLMVDDLVRGAGKRSADEIAYARRAALAEPVVRDRILSPDAGVTGVNVTLQFPGESIDEPTQSVAKAREITAAVLAEHPELDIYLTGVAMLSNAFTEASQRDLQTLIPLMFLGLVVVTGLLLRSVSATIATVAVIMLSVMTAMGLGGFFGLSLTPVSAAAPTMILTLAVADSIHVLVTMLRGMRDGASKHDALVESLRVNMQPVFLTSLTTAIGLLSMNFSDAPPFHHLGNTVATGVAAAFVYSVLLLPALVAILPVRVRSRGTRTSRWAESVGNFVVRYRRPLLVGSGAFVLLLASFIPRNELNDQFVQYFDESIAFRTDTDFTTENLTGVYQVEFSLGAGESGGISEPEYLRTVDAFADWYREQPGVVHVNAFPETIKRLNMNMHADDSAYYRIPGERELAAQYLLLYEMSLPYGLDLNNRINVDKSATRFTATLADLSAAEIRSIAAAGREWLRANTPVHMHAEAASTAVMFAHISQRNIEGMLNGTTLAFALVSLALLVALRSFKLGALSLLPNLIPAAMAFGLWGVTVGKVDVGVSVVIAIAFGIVVDDTVHFLSKYARGRREHGYDSQQAVRYAFGQVGSALVATSIIIAAGFGILAFSPFSMNANMGLLTSATVGLALVADFFFLPPLLMALDGTKAHESIHITSSQKGHTDEYALDLA